MQGGAPPQREGSAAPTGPALDVVLSALDDAVLVARVPDLSPEGRPGVWPVTWASPGAADLLPTAGGALVGADFWDLLPELSGTSEQQLIVDAARSGEPLQLMCRDLPSGRALELRVSGRRDLVVRARDVTESDHALNYSAQLLRLSEDLARAWEPGRVAEVVAKVALPLAGVEGGGLSLADPEHGLMRSLGWTGADERLSEEWATYPINTRTPGTDAWRTGRPVLLEDLDACVRRYPHLAADFARLGRQAVVSLPLVTGAGTIGALVLSFATARRFRPADLQFLSTVAAICAQALARAELYAQEKASVDMLQRSLLPGRVPQPPGTAVAARYLPGHTGMDVGGDWWDVISLPGSTGLVLGDVEGHDLSAAALMGQVRSAVRSYALDGLPPALVVQRTDAFLDSLCVDRLVTLLYLQLHPEEHLVTAVSAGHPAALVSGPGGRVRALPHSLGPPLGVQPEAPRLETTTVLSADAVLMLFSDGLVERRHEDVDVGLARLRDDFGRAVASAATAGDAWADQVADAVVEGSTVDGPAVDDVALLLVGLTAVGSTGARRVTRRLPSLDSSVPIARRFLENLLHAWLEPPAAARDLVDDALLCTSEVVANATRYSSGEVVVVVSLEGSLLRVEVTDSSHRLPRLSAQDDDDSAGRGLRIVDLLCNQWGVDSSGLTKTVWFTMDVSLSGASSGATGRGREDPAGTV